MKNDNTDRRQMAAAALEMLNASSRTFEPAEAPEGACSAAEGPRAGRAKPGPQGVQNPTDNSSSFGRWAKLEWLRDHSKLPRQRSCMSSSFTDRVQVRKGATSIGFGSVMACGSRTCPVCAPNIYGANRADITQAVAAWRHEKGHHGVVLFGTMTVHHRLGDRFADLKRSLSDCWAAVTSGSSWLRDRRDHGVEYWVRVFEEKWSPNTGWHLHIHYLMFVKHGHQSTADRLLKSMFVRWRAAAIAAGMKAPSMKGQDLHEVTEDEAADVLGEYFAKQASTAQRSAEQLALELTMRDGKFTGESLTPGELLTLAMAGDAHAQHLWAEYEEGMKKRRVIAWARGLRQAVGIGDELTDSDAAQLEGEELRRTVMEMRARQYRKVVAFRRRRELLQRVWADGPEAAVLWLRSWGVDAVVGELDDQQGCGVHADTLDELVVPF